MKAYKLININKTESSFEEGMISEHIQINADHFVIQTDIEAYEKVSHPAPRYQFVITIKGRLRFTVTNGDTFIIEPGIILIADDLAGKGHTWEIIDGNEWHRIYIVPEKDAAEHFIPMNS
jgi:quercetin dioxygenase-like cupin family protein